MEDRMAEPMIGRWDEWIEERVRQHDKDLYFGSGRENPPLTTRMDRVERFMETTSNLMKAVLLLLVGAIATGVVDLAVRAHK
jgi:hypothetical protein